MRQLRDGDDVTTAGSKEIAENETIAVSGSSAMPSRPRSLGPTLRHHGVLGSPRAAQASAR
ncbi:hypothetical protein AB0N62_29220 [Streptomyces sp. NPDC093982]|uniref:hypothetical protein n=1 Tax=Streptomyces sp. NPDC093982 TaxID=3155077 RepID=UPI00341E54F0